MVVWRAKLELDLAAADQKNLSAAGFARGQKRMALFNTEMREINDCGRIISLDSED